MTENTSEVQGTEMQQGKPKRYQPNREEVGTICFQSGDRVIYRRRDARVIGVLFTSEFLPVLYHIRLDNGHIIRDCAKGELQATTPPRQKPRANLTQAGK